MLPDLSDQQLERYARHVIMPEIGGQGQRALLAAKVLVVGAGGLGSPCLAYLAAAGVGTIGIVDDDVVALSNLQRQILYTTQDVGQHKTTCAAQRIRALNPDVAVEVHACRLNADNAERLIRPYDIIADGSDSFSTRLIVSDACVRQGKVLVSAAVGRLDGQLATFKGHVPGYPCYRCFVGSAPQREAHSCADEGVVGALTGILGAFQALEVVREITGFGESLAGRIMLLDALGLRMRTLRLPPDPACTACAGHKAG